MSDESGERSHAHVTQTVMENTAAVRTPWSLRVKQHTLNTLLMSFICYLTSLIISYLQVGLILSIFQCFVNFYLTQEGIIFLTVRHTQYFLLPA